jgi:hypothetical protein
VGVPRGTRAATIDVPDIAPTGVTKKLPRSRSLFEITANYAALTISPVIASHATRTILDTLTRTASPFILVQKVSRHAAML